MYLKGMYIPLSVTVFYKCKFASIVWGYYSNNLEVYWFSEVYYFCQLWRKQCWNFHLHFRFVDFSSIFYSFSCILKLSNSLLSFLLCKTMSNGSILIKRTSQVLALSGPRSQVESESESRSVVPDSLRPHGLYRPWDSPGQNTGVGTLSLLGDLPNPGIKPRCPAL